MGTILRKAHAITKKILKEYPGTQYHAQLGICIKYLVATVPIKSKSIDRAIYELNREVFKAYMYSRSQDNKGLYTCIVVNEANIEKIEIIKNTTIENIPKCKPIIFAFKEYDPVLSVLTKKDLQKISAEQLQDLEKILKDIIDPSATLKHSFDLFSYINGSTINELIKYNIPGLYREAFIRETYKEYRKYMDKVECELKSIYKEFTIY